MKKALVLGGAGFIGSNLCEALLNNGYTVVSIDNYSNGTKENHIADVTYIKNDICNLPVIFNDDGEMTCPEHRGFKPDIVFHLAEFCRAEQSYDTPMTAIFNIYHTLPYVIELCKKTNAKLIYSGSSTKFGDGGSPYASCKKLNTMMLNEICNQLNIDYAITYYYNVYGNHEQKTGKFAMLIAKAIQAKKANEVLTVTSPGTQKRYFTNVKDIIKGILLVAEHGHGDGYGIGANEEFSVLDVVKMVGCKYVIGPEKLGNRMGSELKTEKTKALGWQPNHTLPQYIAEQLA
jgi:UDP-glucose 4-epimerase